VTGRGEERFIENGDHGLTVTRESDARERVTRESVIAQGLAASVAGLWQGCGGSVAGLWQGLAGS